MLCLFISMLFKQVDVFEWLLNKFRVLELILFPMKIGLNLPAHSSASQIIIDLFRHKVDAYSRN